MEDGLAAFALLIRERLHALMLLAGGAAAHDPTARRSVQRVSLQRQGHTGMVAVSAR